ncbi:hypothetical protein ACLPHM_05995 [Paenalcaligenes sp. Me131]|uniref:hypothetical protein n=1 Tax=Paenalcaligenes sp. Me131 TaxID=3392636 RepID=UPI003D271F70
MSDQEDQNSPDFDLGQATADLSLEDIIEFFNAKLKNHNCPACLENSWTDVRAADSIHGLIAQPLNGPVTVPAPMYPLVSVSCNNCGFIRSHMAAFVLSWKESNGKK